MTDTAGAWSAVHGLQGVFLKVEDTDGMPAESFLQALMPSILQGTLLAEGASTLFLEMSCRPLTRLWQ